MRVAARSASSTLPQRDRDRKKIAIAKLESLRRRLTCGTTCDSRFASAGNLRDLLFQRSLRPLVRLLVLCKDPLLIRKSALPSDSIILPDSGLTIITRGYAENMAEAVLLTVDQGERASGKIYNCGDDHQLTMAQWVQVIARAMNSTMEIISIPVEYATPSRDMMIGRKHSNHLHYDTYAMRSELGYKDKIPVLEAFNRTVEWYMSNPPSLNKATESNLAQHYNDEDKLIKINVEIIQKYEKLSLANAVFKHAYAHPKKPGDTKDHLGR